jgi:hypothetical protein
LEALRARPPQSRADTARLYGAQLLAAARAMPVSTGGAPLRSGAATVAPTADANLSQLASELTDRHSPVYFPKRYTYLYMARVEREQFEKLQQAIDRLAVQSPQAPGRAMSLVDSSEPQPTRVLLRGNPTTPGEMVSARFLSLFPGPNSAAGFAEGSGRLALAHAITASDNPLTSRVIANRVWMHHLGTPLVATPGDFGTRSEPPSHPLLLDYLAWSLQQHGWSLKQLHREIVLSATYCQSSAHRTDAHAIDPSNRWLWRAQPRRLELEPMRDAMLAVAGMLDSTMFGRPAGVIDQPDNHRRSLYGLVDRQELPGIYRAFDFASPDQSSDQRPRTITPQQALFGLNSPLVWNCTQSLARQSQGQADQPRTTWLFRQILGRPPTDQEVQEVVAYVSAARRESDSPSDIESAWREMAQSLLVSNEFVFVD